MCIQGECVHMKSEEAEILDGQWSEWSEFGECSRTCGGGIMKRRRKCNHPK